MGQHLAGLVGLLPDELLADVALMVKDSCPDLNLMSIETAEMKTVVEAQPTAFVFQLIDELHEICDIFGLIDESKIMTKQIEGTDIELQVYAEDWMSGEKVKWQKLFFIVGNFFCLFQDIILVMKPC